jgi:hypothetical protein
MLAVNHVSSYVAMLGQSTLMFDVNELLAVYGEMLEADRRNGTDFAREQAEYITAHYPLVELSI